MNSSLADSEMYSYPDERPVCQSDPGMIQNQNIQDEEDGSLQYTTVPMKLY